jgi:hypothetical protein
MKVGVVGHAWLIIAAKNLIRGTYPLTVQTLATGSGPA